MVRDRSGLKPRGPGALAGRLFHPALSARSPLRHHQHHLHQHNRRCWPPPPLASPPGRHISSATACRTAVSSRVESSGRPSPAFGTPESSPPSRPHPGGVVVVLVSVSTSVWPAPLSGTHPPGSPSTIVGSEGPRRPLDVDLARPGYLVHLPPPRRPPGPRALLLQAGRVLFFPLTLPPPPSLRRAPPSSLPPSSPRGAASSSSPSSLSARRPGWIVMEHQQRVWNHHHHHHHLHPPPHHHNSGHHHNNNGGHHHNRRPSSNNHHHRVVQAHHNNHHRWAPPAPSQPGSSEVRYKTNKESPLVNLLTYLTEHPGNPGLIR